MSHIKLKDFTPQAGMEWSSGAYPGDGAYLTSIGVFLVVSGIVFGFNVNGWRSLVEGDGTSESIDVHRLLDQMISLTGKPK